jgi:hypothetical protein
MFRPRDLSKTLGVIQYLDDGALRFLRPDGRSFDSVAPEHTRALCDGQELPAFHDQHGLRIDKTTAATRWRGEKMDYELAIEVLFQHARRARGVSAEMRRLGRIASVRTRSTRSCRS